MNDIEFSGNVSFIKKGDLILFTIIGFIIILVYRYSYICEITFLQNILKIIKLLVFIILFMFLNHIKKISNEKIYKIIEFFILIRTSLMIINLSYYNQYEFAKKILLNLNITQYYAIDLIYITIIGHLITFNFYKKDSERENTYTYFLKIIIYIYGSWILGLKFGNLFTCISAIIIIYINVNSIMFINEYRIKNENENKNKNKNKNKFDLLKFNIKILSFYGVIHLIEIFVDLEEIIILNKIIDCFILLLNVMLIVYIIHIFQQIIKQNYNFVFVETIEENKKLEYINSDINASNIWMENAYRKINDRKNLYKNYLAEYGQPIILLNENFRIQYCNNRFLSLFNENDIKNIINRKIETFIDFDSNIYESIAKKERFITVINIFDALYEVEFINLIEEDIGIILSFKDLSEDLKIIKMKEELEVIKERELIKTNFLSNISHDIKTPINVIYSEIQLEKIFIENKDKVKLEEYNEISKKNCLNLTKLTNNIIDMSKIDSENLEPNLERGNIVEFIEEYINNLSNYIKNNGLEIVFDTEEEVLETIFDREMMRRILINLISNSIKYSSNKGTITINILEEKDSIIIEFKDDGIGMNEVFINRIFEKYSMERREEGDSKGFGIGLYVVFNLVKAQNAEIKVTSILGKGSKFEIKFYK